MPLYPYECDDVDCRDRVEALLLLREYEAGVKPDCPTCHGPMHRIWLASHERAQHFDPIVIHESHDGEFSFPMHPNAPVPPGFQKRELRTFAEADAVMRRVNALERRKVDEKTAGEREWLNHMEATNRRELREAMRHMQPKMRAFAELAMRVNDAKARPKPVDPNCYLEVRERDSSNREAYRDQQTGWKERRR